MRKLIEKRLILLTVMAVMLCAAMVLLLVNPYAVNVSKASDDFLTNLTIGGVAVNISGDQESVDAGQTPTWVLEDEVLTLNNYVGGAIVAQGGLNIVLAAGSQNVITATPRAIEVLESLGGSGSLSITGAGTLSAVSESADSSVAAISAAGAIQINARVTVSASTDGTTVENGIARGIYSQSSITFEDAQVSVAASGAYAYAICTGAATDGDITVIDSQIQASSIGEYNDTALRTESFGDVSIISGAVTLSSKQACVYADDIVISGGELSVTGVNGGLNARLGVAISGGSIRVIVTQGAASDVYGIKCQSGVFEVDGEQTKVYVESTYFGILAIGGITVNEGKLQVISNGSGSYASYTEGNVNINGGTYLSSGRGSGIVIPQLGKIFVRGEEKQQLNLHVRNTVYVSESGEYFGGDRYLLRFRGDVFCQFQKPDNLITEGWALDFETGTSSFVLKLNNYEGGEVFTEASLIILCEDGSFNRLVSSQNAVVRANNVLTVAGKGFLEIVGPNDEYKSAVYVGGAVNLVKTNLIATAGGYGIECINGQVVIDEFSRLFAAGAHYPIFAEAGLKINDISYNEEDFSSSGIYGTGGKTLIKDGTIPDSELYSLKVDGAVIDIGDDASGSGWQFIKRLQCLVLDNYDGGYIYASGNLDVVVLAGTENKATDLGALSELVGSAAAYLGVASSGYLRLSGGGKLILDVAGAEISDIAYALYANNSVIVNEVQLEIHCSNYGIFANYGTVELNLTALVMETSGDGVTANGDITLTECEIDIISGKFALYSKFSRVVFDGGDASVYGGLRSAVANLNLYAGETMFVTGAPSDPGSSQLQNAFNIVDGVLTSTFERSIFKIMGQYYNYEGEAIDLLDTNGWKFDYDSANSKYILYLSGYQGNSIQFSLSLEIVVLGGQNEISFVDNTELGDTHSCIEVGGALTISGSGTLRLRGGGGTGGIGIYAQNCTINGDITIDTTEVSRGIAVENVLTIQNCQYSGAYITASSIYITGGTLQINGTANAVNCIVASNLFQMSGNASLTLTTTANSITLTCISAQRAVINSGTLTATANGAFGRAISAVFDIRLNSPDIVLFGGQCAVFSGNDTVVFGNSVLGFAGADAAGAVKNRRVNDTYKYVKTQLFVFTPQDLVFDALLEDGEVIEFGENIAYFEGIIANGVALVRDRDYIIEGENVRLTDSFLRSLPDGVLWLELQFGDGFTKTVSLTVTNSSVVISPAPQKDFVGIIVVASLSAVLVALFALSAVKEFRKKKRARKDSGLFLD
jgi:hypothetical protein